MPKTNSAQEKVIKTVRGFADALSSNRSVESGIAQLMDETAELPLTNINFLERFIRDEFEYALKQHAKIKWVKPIAYPESFKWFSLISSNGHIRQRAMENIIGPAPNRFFLALALRRLNDWVFNVRAAAREKIPLLIEQSNPCDVADALCLTLINWHSWQRVKQLKRQLILDIITKDGIASKLKERIIFSTAGPMTALLSQIGRTKALDGYLLEIAKQAVQPAVRAQAYRWLFEEKAVWLEGRQWQWTNKAYGQGRYVAVVGEREITVKYPLLQLLNRCAEDPSSIVRRVAAEFLIRDIKSLGENAYSLAERFAADKSSAVSERGAFALRQLAENE